MNNTPDIKKSKCFTCKFGICVKQNQQTHIFPVQGSSTGPKEPWEQGNEEADHDHAMLKDNGHFALCFWPTVAMKEQIPIQLGFVEECNRYEEENSGGKGLAKPKK